LQAQQDSLNKNSKNSSKSHLPAMASKAREKWAAKKKRRAE